MAGGPYKGNQGGYYCRWSDSRGHPQDDKKAESLKTKKKGEAIKRLSILETLQQSGYHDPWHRKWFDNSQIKNIVFSGYLDIEALQSGQLTAKNRSEERRVGKECRSRWARYQIQQNKNNDEV